MKLDDSRIEREGEEEEEWHELAMSIGTSIYGEFSHGYPPYAECGSKKFTTLHNKKLWMR